MILKITDTLKNLAPAAIIPIAAGAPFQKAIAAVANAAGLSPEMIETDFKAAQGEVQPLYNGTQRYYLLGLGEAPGFAEILKCFRSFSYKYRQKIQAQLGISFLHDNLSGDISTWAEAAVNGLLLGSYKIGLYKSEAGAKHHALRTEEAQLSLGIEAGLANDCQQAAKRGQAVAETQMKAFDLVKCAPVNKKVAGKPGQVGTGIRQGMGVFGEGPQ